MSFPEDYQQLRQVKNAFVRWQSERDWSHSMTLAYNRPMPVDLARTIFGRFCKEIDRAKFGRRNVTAIRSLDRFQAVGVFEHLETNIHVHIAAKLNGWWPHDPTKDDFTAFADLWEKCTKGAGDLQYDEISSSTGWLYYMTKDFAKNDCAYVLSSDFHPF